ncbi:MAG TPA: flagellar biosynthetic protein FliO [Verrucomicrobiae bacterium]|jgi:flagellar biogenesis protein FliO|nr:flagellar biosynthetic protein FliO [Verrucomicrobiae bacterium]
MLKADAILKASGAFIIPALLATSTGFSAEATNSPALPLTLPQLPDAGPSVLRVMGALALVLGIFLGGVWVFRNWQRLTIQRGRAPKLNVIETRSLGGKQALYVVGYEQERFLLASSPAGVNLLSHLPAATETDGPADTTSTPAAPSFAQALTKVLKGK